MRLIHHYSPLMNQLRNPTIRQPQLALATNQFIVLNQLLYDRTVPHTTKTF